MTDSKVTLPPKGEDILKDIVSFIGTKNLENLKTTDALNKLFYKKPKKDWIKYNALAKSYYIPIGIIETLLHKVFIRFRIEIVSYSQVANSLAVHIRLHYWDTVHNDWSYHDGIGAVPIQLKKELKSSTIDFTSMQSAAVQMGLPAAKSFAIKDACEHFGPLF